MEGGNGVRLHVENAPAAHDENPIRDAFSAQVNISIRPKQIASGSRSFTKLADLSITASHCEGQLHPRPVLPLLAAHCPSIPRFLKSKSEVPCRYQ